ncbi:MAG: FAD-binding oxidoreductase, partial [Candidatus Binatia bacterium]
VLASGDVLQTKRLHKRELNRKKGLDTFEGEIYRQLDGLITDNWDTLQQYKETQAQTSKNASGYALADVKQKDGSFDLTPLFVGSQGTLGIVSEAILTLESHMPTTTLAVIECQDIDAAEAAVEKILPLGPSALEMVDGHLLTALQRSSPALLSGLVEAPFPSIVLLAEFDDPSSRKQLSKTKKMERALKGLASSVRISSNFEEQEALWSIRRSAAAVMSRSEDGKAALPIIEDGIVPRAKFKELLTSLYELLKKYSLEVAVWGHAGDANLHVQPMMDLSQLGDRQKAFRLMEEYNKLVIRLGGNMSAEHNDGRLRAPYLAAQHGKDVHDLLLATKKIFDPHDILNPGVKFGTSTKDLVAHLRERYSVDHLHDYLPYT